MKKKHMIIESSIFFIISSIVYLYVKKNNPNNVIERYYMTQSKVLYNLFKISTLIIKFTIFFNIKFLIIIAIKNKFLLS